MTEYLWAVALLVILATTAAGIWNRGSRIVTIMPGSVGVTYRDGRFVREIGPGRHRRFDLYDRTLVLPVTTAPQALPSQRIEVITRDRFAFRVDVALFVTVFDARLYAEGAALQDAGQSDLQVGWSIYAAAGVQGALHGRLNTLVASAVVETISTLTLEQFLAAQSASIATIEPALADAVAGLRVDGVRLTAVILPPEIRKMFTEIERARAEAMAALERARGEQAALRALANAARALAGNPELSQLRLLQTMDSAKGAKTFVLGGTVGEFATGVEGRGS